MSLPPPPLSDPTFSCSLSVIDASGRQISLLNDQPGADTNSSTTAAIRRTHSASSSCSSSSSTSNNIIISSSIRRYHCTEPGCNKSFTTSGHLARHNRIHTGEKNFHCLYPGCPSRFSRQDNMMQHYRTHMSPRSRRGQQRTVAATRLGVRNRVTAMPPPIPPRPRCHAYIYSDASATVHHLPFSCCPVVPPSPPKESAFAMASTASARNGLPRPHVLEPSFRTRASSVSSCSSSNSSLPSPTLLPPLNQPQSLQEQKYHDGQKKNQSTSSDLLQLAYIVSTFG